VVLVAVAAARTTLRTGLVRLARRAKEALVATLRPVQTSEQAAAVVPVRWAVTAPRPRQAQEVQALQSLEPPTQAVAVEASTCLALVALVALVAVATVGQEAATTPERLELQTLAAVAVVLPSTRTTPTAATAARASSSFGTRSKGTALWLTSHKLTTTAPFFR
jgi:hypothetical protein